MKKLYFVILLFICLRLSAQNYQTVQEINEACDQLGFVSNEEAEIAVDKILGEFGLIRTFVIQECPDINNAVAKVIEISEGQKERYILYDSNFFDRINSKASTDWAAMSILAHEIGHHLNGHSLNDVGSNHAFELEADYFSGAAMGRLGASLEQAQSAISTFKYEKATRTHPAKVDRLKAIKDGWIKSQPKKTAAANNNSRKKLKKEVIINNNEDNIEVYKENSSLVTELVNKAMEANSSRNFYKAGNYLVDAYKYTNGQEPIYLYYAASSFVNGLYYEEALKYYLLLVKNGINKLEADKSKEIYKNIALIYTQLNETKKAKGFFEIALNSNPNDVNLILSLANLYFKEGNKEKFKELMLSATQKEPNNADLHYNIGVINMEQGNLAAARKNYVHVIKLDPNYTNAYLNLSTTYINEGNLLIDEMNSLGVSTADTKKYNELKNRKEKLFLDGANVLEKFLKVNPYNTLALTQLKNIYGAMGDTSNFNRVKKILGE